MGFRQARLRAGKSVSDVMEAIHVSDAAVYSWETGAYQPRSGKLIQLARFYGCSVEDLLANDSIAEDGSDKPD